MKLFSSILASALLIIELLVIWDASYQLNNIDELIGPERAQSELSMLLHYYLSIAFISISVVLFVGVIYRIVKSGIFKGELVLIILLAVNILLPIWFWR